MVSYKLQNYEYDIIRLVLILIVVEDGLVRCTVSSLCWFAFVLILIVVEDGLVQVMKISVGKNGTVS